MQNKSLLESLLRTIKTKSHKNKKGRGKGCSGLPPFLGDYKTLKVIPRSKRTPENSDKFGIAK